MDDSLTNIARHMASECIAVRVRLISRVVTRMYDGSTSKFKITLNQVSILVAIAQTGEMDQSMIEKIFYMDKSTVSRNVERLRRRGWLDVIGETEGRANKLRLTKTGEQVLYDIYSRWETAQEKTRHFLGENAVNCINDVASQIWKHPEK